MQTPKARKRIFRAEGAQKMKIRLPNKRSPGIRSKNSLVYRFIAGLTPQQQPGSYQGGQMMMMMKSVFWWRKPEYPEETTDLRQVTDETFHTCIRPLPSPGIELGPQRCEAK